MELYRLECINEYGDYEINGHFLDKKNAEIRAREIDNETRSKKYGLVQDIVTIQTED